jgi:hypothetical protein
VLPGPPDLRKFLSFAQIVGDYKRVEDKRLARWRRVLAKATVIIAAVVHVNYKAGSLVWPP